MGNDKMCVDDIEGSSRGFAIDITGCGSTQLQMHAKAMGTLKRKRRPDFDLKEPPTKHRHCDVYVNLKRRLLILVPQRICVAYRFAANLKNPLLSMTSFRRRNSGQMKNSYERFKSWLTMFYTVEANC